MTKLLKRRVIVGAVAVAALALAGVGARTVFASSSGDKPSHHQAASATGNGSDKDSALSKAPTFDNELWQRIAKAEAYAESRPGVTGIVVRDRKTGAVWRNSHAATHAWACSTPKLAMVVDLLLRNDSGKVKLTADDRSLMQKMLHSSDDDAATTMWYRYGGEAEYAKRFPSYGMTDMQFTKEHKHHWGWIRTTPNDLDRLVNYVLEKLPAKHRDYIVHELSNVDANQQWGVWGAGPKAKPGNKDGWSDDNDDGSWIMNSVGFVGPNQRYTVAIMSNTQVVKDGYNVGKETTTRISEILFNGYFK